MYSLIIGFVIAIKLGVWITQVSASPDQLLSDIQTEANHNQPVLIIASDHNYKNTIENVRRAIKGMNFLLIKEQNLIDGFNMKSANSSQRIIYFCNFAKANKAIKSDYRVGQFLPFRITIMETNGKVYVSSINPKMIYNFVHNKKLNKFADEMYNVYVALLNEATF